MRTYWVVVTAPAAPVQPCVPFSTPSTYRRPPTASTTNTAWCHWPLAKPGTLNVQSVPSYTMFVESRRYQAQRFPFTMKIWYPFMEPAAYLFRMPFTPMADVVRNQTAAVIGYGSSAGWWTTLTASEIPRNERALPMKPVIQVAPLTLPWKALPEASAARMPVPSSSFQCATSVGDGVGVGTGVGVGDGAG